VARTPSRADRLQRPPLGHINLGLVVLNTIMLRLLFRWQLVGDGGLQAPTNGWGLINHLPGAFRDRRTPCRYRPWTSSSGCSTSWSTPWGPVAAAPVHHADLDYDVTTPGALPIPSEFVLSHAQQSSPPSPCSAPPVVALVIFEVMLNATALFNHGNIRLPAGVDRCCAGSRDAGLCTGCASLPSKTTNQLQISVSA